MIVDFIQAWGQQVSFLSFLGANDDNISTGSEGVALFL
jgi:hypothetical protein